MTWLSNFVRPRIQAMVGKRDIPDNMWVRCNACSQMIFHRELDRNLRVCPKCQTHMRLSPEERFRILFDEKSWTVFATPSVRDDPFIFRDQKRYIDRLRDARKSHGDRDALVCAEGKIDKALAVVAVFDFSFLGGSMGVAVGQGLIAASKRAIEKKAALITITSSGGARMQEGILSLMQMPRTVIAISQLREAGLPYLSLLSDPTTGGVSASFAMLGDIILAEPGAIIGFAGARVIKNTIREALPEDFQKAESLYKHGLIDMVVHRRDLKKKLGQIIHLLQKT